MSTRRARTSVLGIKHHYSTAVGVGAPSLFCAGGRAREWERNTRDEKKPYHPESSLLNCGNRRNAHHDTKFLRLRDFS